VSIKKEKEQSFKVAGVDVEINWFYLGQLHVLEVQNKLYVRTLRWDGIIFFKKTVFDTFWK
jgi:hypothetical protein